MTRQAAKVNDRVDAGPNREFPLVAELRPMPDPETAFLQLSSWPRCLFLDSALRHSELGRYSFVTADPFDRLEVAVDELSAAPTAFERLAARLQGFSTSTRPDLPPFQGGAAGLFGYELGRQLERLPAARFDEFRVEPCVVGFYDVVVAFDHLQHKAWIISQGLPETEPSRRRRRAQERTDSVRRQLEAPIAKLPCPQRADSARTIARSELCLQHDVGNVPGLTSDFSRSEYLDVVSRAIEYIRAGDIFQVNLSQRLLYPAQGGAPDLYLRLRQRNPATFAAYFDAGEFQIASASPERFLKVAGGHVETRPIKGTRPRTLRPEADLFAGDDLAASEKDRAENVMIVDLLRNDLSRVCRPESVRVSQLCRLETYQYVQHLVSAVEGELAGHRTAIDLLAAAFPGGSITGAPKIRAMEIIAELEPTARGPYCGALGYMGFDGAMDTSILIRTITAGRGWWQAPVGGGIVAQSSPQREYAETWHKAEGLLRAMIP
jgi:para-aminobenzoate synthetase component 1